LISQLIPDLDRHDKFAFLLSVYRATYYSHNLTFIIVSVLGALTILPPLLEARTGVESTTALVGVSIAFFLATTLISKWAEGWFLDRIKARNPGNGGPHIRHASVAWNGLHILWGALLVYYFAFGAVVPGVVNSTVNTDVLLSGSGGYMTAGLLIQRLAATILYSALVIWAVAAICRGISVLYYNLRL